MWFICYILEVKLRMGISNATYRVYSGKQKEERLLVHDRVEVFDKSPLHAGLGGNRKATSTLTQVQ